MTLLPFCQWLAETRGSIALHESLYMYPLVESVHVLTLCLFIGMTAVLDFRLVGIGFQSVPITDITRRLGPWLQIGFVIMVITGFLLFYAIPIRSYQSVWFRVKVIMLILAGLNAGVFQWGIYKRVEEWNLDRIVPKQARMAGVFSLILWAGIIIAGRMIAYNWFDCDVTKSPVILWAAGCTPKGE
jgi:hypothetical protein